MALRDRIGRRLVVTFELGRLRCGLMVVVMIVPSLPNHDPSI